MYGVKTLSGHIPNSVIGAVASVIADHYYSHSKLETLFMEAGAPGDVPEGNCEKKCSNWLKRCNDDPTTDALQVLGDVLQSFMDIDPSPPSARGSTSNSKVSDGQQRIHSALAKNQLTYRTNGFITRAGSNPITKTLEDFLKSGDFSSIEKEFDRAIANIDTDPHSAVTAACSIIESALKFYIETHKLDMPTKLNVMPLWQTVQSHLTQNSDPNLADDQYKMLKRMTSIIDGAGAFRSHIGSAHGRGKSPPKLTISEARLAVNASHTIVVFVMEGLHSHNEPAKSPF